jgi:hypothetical protein
MARYAGAERRGSAPKEPPGQIEPPGSHCEDAFRGDERRRGSCRVTPLRRTQSGELRLTICVKRLTTPCGMPLREATTS